MILPLDPKKLLIPWLELNSRTPALVDRAVEGLQLWQQITKTALVSTTPGHADLYSLLLKEVPGMRIIPGLKTALILPVLDDIDGWRKTAAEIEVIRKITHCNHFLLEMETAIHSYRLGEYEVDWTRFQECLAVLPRANYWWYPGILGRTATVQDRYHNLCMQVNNISPRFVDRSLSWPEYMLDPWMVKAGEDLNALTIRPIPIFYFLGPDSLSWKESALPIALRWAGKDTVILYPGSKRWVECAQVMVELFGEQ
jgi:hypothetical protein